MLFSRKKNKAPQKQINGIKVNGPCVIIKDAGSMHHLDVHDQKFIKQNLNKPLRIFDVTWNSYGSIECFAVLKGDTAVTLFARNGTTFEFV